MTPFDIHEVIEWAVSRDADALHIRRKLPPVVQKETGTIRMSRLALNEDDCIDFMKHIAPEKSPRELKERGGSEFRYEFDERVHFRAAIFLQGGSVGVVLKCLRSSAAEIDGVGNSV